MFKNVLGKDDECVLVIGADIGGTKCAVNLGEISKKSATVIHKCKVRKTAQYQPYEMLDALCEDMRDCMAHSGSRKIRGIGISCGGPLDESRGIILSPPNLPGWDNIAITDYFQEKIGIPAWLCNDANACALAEWKLGAGKECSHMVFLTFGTGLGAGIIVNGRLYTGACGMAGEIGHIRLSDYGPSGYGKMGSFEGFCSGSGIAQLAKTMVTEKLQQGEESYLCKNGADLPLLTAESVGAAAKKGDSLSLDILRQVGIQLGKGLSILIDFLNPERIVIGSIFVRNYDEIWPYAKQVIEKETLPAARNACQVLPSQLSESVGDIAGLVVAGYHLEMEDTK